MPHTHRGQIYSLTESKVLAVLNPDNWNAATDEFTAEEIKEMMETSSNTIEVHTDKFYVTSKVLKRNSNGNAVKFKVMFSPVKINDRYIEVKEQANDFRKGRICTFDGSLSFAANLAPAEDGEIYGGFLEYDGGNVSAKFNGDVPATGINRTQARQLCRQAGRECMNYYSYMYILYWAFVIEYCTLNCKKPVINELDDNGFHQGGLGIGMTSADERIINNVNYFYNSDINPKCKARCIGVTNSLGNHTGEIVVQENNHTYHQNRYRGFEFPFGDINGVYDGIGGFVISQENFRKRTDTEWVDDFDGIIGYYMTDDPNNYFDNPTGSVTEMECVAKIPSYNKGNMYDEGSFKLAVIDDSALLIPCETDHNFEYHLNFCAGQYGAADYFYTNDYCCVSLMGGTAESDTEAGLAYFDASSIAISLNKSLGFSGSRFIDDSPLVPIEPDNPGSSEK